MVNKRVANISKNKWKRIFIVLFFLLGTVFVFSQRDDIFYRFFHKDKPFIHLISTEKGYPFVNTKQELSIFSINKKTSTQTKITVTSFESSSDSLYTAFVDDKSGDLWIMSNETFQKNQITKEGEIANDLIYWSPDSTKLLFGTRDNEVCFNEGCRNEDPHKAFESKPMAPPNSGDVILYDTKTGMSTIFSDLHSSSIIRFFDNNNLLITHQNHDLSSQVLLYNLTNHTLKPSLIPDEGSPKFNGFSISPDNTKWTISVNMSGTVDHNNSEQEEILTNFPDITGMSIEAGDFTNPLPIFSPDSSKLAFCSNTCISGQPVGVMPSRLIILDIHNQTSKIYNDSFPLQWIDDSLLIVRSIQYPSNTYLLNTQTSERVLIK